MNIIQLPFESSIILTCNNKVVKVTVFLTGEPDNIKFGVDAPRGIKINREEIYFKKLKKIALKNEEEGCNVD